MMKLKRVVVPSMALVYLVYAPLGEAICHSYANSIQQELDSGVIEHIPCHLINKQLDSIDKCPTSDSRIAGVEMVNCISGVINVYSPVLAICDGGNITVEHPHLFSPGDKVLIHQAQGASCNSTNTQLCGDLLDLGGAGLYEFNTIRSIQGTNITFEYFLLNDYDLAGKVQMVSVPFLGDTSVCNLTCAPWNGTTGGILVFEGGRIEVSGDIDVSGKGFRGGILTPWPSNMLETILDYIGQNSNDGGMKGEGIAFLPTALQWGRGKWTNGGGGGNNHNAGGGGGAGAGNGGFGGTYLGFPLETRGIGGQGVFSFGRLYFGGGGGAGHDNNNFGQSGSPGGGIVLIQVDQFVSQGPFAIKADGASGSVAGIDGAGGGGGGGSICIKADSDSSILTFSALGGKGGDNNSFPDDYQCVGTGGGGGGGSIFSEVPLASVAVEGGSSGLVVNNATYFACVPKPQSGYAEDGSQGEVEWQVPDNSASIPYFNFSFESFELVGSCDSLLLHIGLGAHSQDLVFTFGDQEFLSGDTLFLDSAGVYLLKVANQCMDWDTLVTIVQPNPLMLHLDSLSHVYCQGGTGTIVVSGSGGMGPYMYTLNGGPPQQNGVFIVNAAGSYTITISDKRGCMFEESHSIIDYGEIIELEVEGHDLEWSCRDTTVLVSLKATSSAGNFWFWLNDTILVQDSILNSLMPGEYSIQAEDEHGCKSDPHFFEILDASVPDTFYLSVWKCKGDNLTVGDSVYTKPGNYVNYIDNNAGCDSLIFSTLALLDTNNIRIEFSICEGENIVLGGNEYDEPGNYSIVLNNVHGCDSTLNITIRRENEQICDSLYCRVYIPNAFSPNGDGINDIFRPYSPTIEFLELEIYDRWGGLLYFEKSSAPSWNGFVGKDSVDPGVFVFILKGICSNNQNIIFKGDVTVTY